MNNSEALRSLYREYLSGKITLEEYNSRKENLEYNGVSNSPEDLYSNSYEYEESRSAKEEHIEALRRQQELPKDDKIKQLNSKINKTNIFALLNFILIIILGLNVLQPAGSTTITNPIAPIGEAPKVEQPEVEIFTPEAPTFLEFPKMETESLTSSPTDFETIMQEAYKSIFQITCTYLPGTSYVGSAWAATVRTPEGGDRTLLVTNHHVIEECLTGGTITASNQTYGEFLTEIYTAEGGYWDVKQVGSTDSLRDLATLQPVINQTISGFKFQKEPAALNQWVAAVGYPSAEGEQVSERRTTVGTIIEFEEISRMILTSAEVKPGNSGGPLINNRGEIVGTVFANSSEREGVGFAQPLQYGCTIIFECVDNKIQYEENIAKIYLPLQKGQCLGYSIGGQYNLQNMSCDSFNVLFQIEKVENSIEDLCEGYKIVEIVAGQQYSFCAKKFE